MIELEKQLQTSDMGVEERNYLTHELDEKKRIYNQYSADVRKTVETDSDVIKKLNELSVAGMRKTAQDMQKRQEEMKRTAEEIIKIVGRFSLNLLKEQWSAAIDYATTYYDKLNEIRVVTEMSEADAAKLGESYRNMAEDMNVTSTELASAAVTFYRQGLNDDEVNGRLEWVTKYAKVANISFENAAELVTATSNAMSKDIQGDVQRVVDVFLYLGDHAATTGEEIGKAMQKASASATEFGLSFEWLGAYIATVSEQTRQAPETIGNAFNTMMARMHQIRAQGFNSEDETKINDVAKALATINVTLMDSEGEWRNMNLIYEDVAKQWETLDDDQRAYIATTMAGVRQQNVFYALMNDLSKGLENGSRAWELYEGAMNSAGTATEKYAIWQESIAASQADLTNSLERLYAHLEPTVIKTFYSVVTTLVDGLNELGGTIPVIIAGITGLGGAIFALGAGASLMNAILAGAVAMLAALGVGGGIGALFNTSSQKYKEAVQSYDSATKKIQQLAT